MACAFPEQGDRQKLPIDSYKYTILDHIRSHPVTCIHGETGCGKSTRVPEFILEEYSQKILFDEENVTPPNIVITQPRRIGATSLARRVSEDLGETEVGKLVGYKIGQDKKCCELTQICYVTTGYLIELLVHFPDAFDKYTHVILDEIHERDLDADLLSLMVKLLMETETHHRPKLVVMSATLQVDLFLKYFVGNLDRKKRREHVLDINVESPFSVDVKYLEEFYRFLFEKGIEVSEDTRKLILITYCQFLQIRPRDLDTDSDHGEHALMIELADSLEDTRPVIKLNNKKVRPVDEYLSLAVSLIKATAEGGSSILVFLPGVREIEELFDKLLPYEDSLHRDWKCQLLLFQLHSKVPFNDQLECFQTPEPGLCHVIMATNIAESSITLPKINVVLDFGQRRNLTYDTDMRIQFLQLGWCSKASMQQRKGRTGRVCDGVCFRIMPCQYYDQLEDYDEAQMKKAPLDKLVLQVKQVAEKISPKESPSELLAQTVEPPSTGKIDCAVKNLAGIGAITKNDENAKVTLLGRLCTCLPLDLYLCRLVMFGMLFSQPCDAIVMAAALQGQDPFRKPTKRIIKNQEIFIRALRTSCDSRRKFDGKCYSEPIMYRNMMKEWLTVVDKENKKNIEESEQDRDGNFMIEFRRKFCKHNDIDSKALGIIDGVVLEIAESLLKWLPRDSPNRTKVEDLIKIVPTKRKLSQSGGIASKWQPHHTFMDQVEDLFCENVLQLHMIMAASFVPRFLAGKVTSRKGYIQSEILKMEMQEHEMDRSRSVVIADLPPEVQVADDKVIRHMIQNLSLRSDSVIQKHAEVNFSFAKKEDKLYVEFDKLKDKQVPEQLKVTDDVHAGVHYMYQFSEAPSVKKNKFAYQIKQPGDGHGRLQHWQLTMPQNPYKTEWILLSYDGSALTCSVPDKECRVFGDWRNPVGFVFDTSKKPHYGVTADVRAGGGGGDKKNKAASKNTDLWMGGFGWAEGASLFPTYQNNRFALLLMLAFVPNLDQVFFTVNTKTMAIVKVNLYDVPMEVTGAYPLNKKLFRTINKLRLKISKIFTDSLCQRESQLPDSDVEKMFHRLMHELQEDQAASCPVAAAVTDDGKTAAAQDLLKKVIVPASYRSQEVSVDEFVYLHPYDTNVLFKKQVFHEFYSQRQNLDLYSSDSFDSDDLMETLSL